MRSQISGQPVDVVSTDRHTVKPWLAGKLPVAAEVVDLAEAGFPLAGGRIDIVAGAGVPTLVYKRRDHLISVTELRAEGDETAIPRDLAVEGYPVVRWSDNERAYVAVSDLSPTELDAFVAAFRRAVAKERGGGGGGGGAGSKRGAEEAKSRIASETADRVATVQLYRTAAVLTSRPAA